jgi:hypothetical protein
MPQQQAPIANCRLHGSGPSTRLQPSDDVPGHARCETRGSTTANGPPIILPRKRRLAPASSRTASRSGTCATEMSNCSARGSDTLMASRCIRSASEFRAVRPCRLPAMVGGAFTQTREPNSLPCAHDRHHHQDHHTLPLRARGRPPRFGSLRPTIAWPR